MSNFRRHYAACPQHPTGTVAAEIGEAERFDIDEPESGERCLQHMEKRCAHHGWMGNGNCMAGFSYEPVEQASHTSGNVVETLSIRWRRSGINQPGVGRVGLGALDIIERSTCPGAKILILQRGRVCRLQP